jgi:hypothetical protein
MSDAMPARAILWPVLAQVALTFCVGLLLLVRRVTHLRARRIALQAVATSAGMAAAIPDTRAADNFRNLFELPVLFYAAAIVVYAASLATPAYVALAWAFVATRVVHSAIHCGYNRVAHRFAAYFAGCMIVAATWALIGLDVAAGRG